MKQFVILVLLNLLASNQILAKDPVWNPIQRIETKRLDKLSLNGKEQLIYADSEGNIYQYSGDGDYMNHYSPIFQSRLSKLESYWTVNIFLFSADLQRYQLLDRFLNPLTDYRFEGPDLGIIKAATLGNNHVIWLFDETDLSLKKWDYRRKQILQDQPLTLIIPSKSLEIVEITERNNLVFLTIKKEGVFIFDNQGNFLKKLDHGITGEFSLSGDFLFHLENGRIQRVNYFTGEVHSVPLPDQKYRKVIIGKSRVYFYDSSYIDVYERPEDI